MSLLKKLQKRIARRAASLDPLVYRHRQALRQSLASPVQIGPFPAARRQPVIIIGMHRSGTTLCAKLLDRAQIFTGHNITGPNFEAPYFQRHNRAIFGLAQAEWETPRAVGIMLRDPQLRDVLAQELYEDLTSKNVRAHLGPERYARARSPFELDEPWGWKDPRTTYTLPVWLRLFPNAKVLHVTRNGIDVSNSLVVRERKRYQAGAAAFFSMMDYASAFDLWADYVGRAFEVTAQLGQGQVHTVIYERLLRDPAHELRAIFDFLAHPQSDAQIAELAKGVKPERANAFRSNPELVELYEQKKDHPFMRQLGYHSVE